MEILIKNGYLIDPKSKKEGKFDILISKGKVEKISKKINKKVKNLIDAKGKFIFPGLIDIHCHLREPGREDEETILSGSKAAVSGGFTTICCMPNTDPPLDNKVAIRFVYDRGKEAFCEVLPIGTITIKREGKLLAPYGEMVKEGAVAFSDDGNCVMDSLVMRRALEYTKLHRKPVISHSEDENLKKNGVMNEGALSTKMGLRGIPKEAEEIMVARDISLSNLTGGRIHLAHITTSNSVKLIKEAKRKNKRITCEAAIHHLILTEEAVSGYNPNAKVSPPLRTENDRKSLIAGLKEGIIDCIVTDHAPHSEEEKEMGFEMAPFGMIGFETALSLSMRLLDEGFSLREIIGKFTEGPSRVMGIDRGEIKEGKRADIVIFDPDYEWVYKKEEIKSKSKNSPFINWKLKGKVIWTIYSGKIVYQID